MVQLIAATPCLSLGQGAHCQERWCGQVTCTSRHRALAPALAVKIDACLPKVFFLKDFVADVGENFGGKLLSKSMTGRMFCRMYMFLHCGGPKVLRSSFCTGLASGGQLSRWNKFTIPCLLKSTLPTEGLLVVEESTGKGVGLS